MGRPGSFRVRFALLAVLILGTVLAATGVFLHRYLARLEMVRLDRGIAGVADRQGRFMDRQGGLLKEEDPTRRPPDRGPAFLGEKGLIYHVWVRAGEETLEKSDDWPAAVTGAHLPEPPRRRPGPAGRRPGRPGPPPGPDRVWPDGEGPPDWRPGHPPPLDGPPPGPEASMASGGPAPVHLTTLQVQGRTRRLCAHYRRRIQVYVLLDLAVHRDLMQRITAAIVGILSGALAVGALGGWWLSGRAIRPVLEVTRLAEATTASDLSKRIPTVARDREFGRLIRVFNEMLERLEASFHQAARFSADASHELRTPLAVMQGQVEAALREVPEGGEAQRALARQLEEVHRLKAMVEALLLLARADRGVLLSRRRTLALDTLLARVLEDVEATAPDLSFHAAIAAGAEVDGDPELLERVLRNLLVNAARYNRPGGRVRVELKAEPTVTLVVANTGPAIPPKAQERIFERFYRADPARSRRVDGVGLGLSLAAEIARAHGGTLELASSTAEETRFVLRLPGAAGGEADSPPAG